MRSALVAPVGGLLLVGAALVAAGSTPQPSVPTAPTAASPVGEVPGTTGPTAGEPDPTDPPPAPTEPVTLTVALSGDVLLHNGTWATAALDAADRGEQGLDFGPLLAGVRPVVSAADLAICHLETPLAPRGGPYFNYPVFSVPPQIVPALRETGYDLCTTASNHSVDQGFDGVRRTIEDLRAGGLGWSGTAATRAQSRRIPVSEVVVDGPDGSPETVRVAVLSSTYGTNGLPVEEPWSVDLIDPDRIVADAARAKAEGADLVLVALHAGTEYVEEPDAYQRDVVEQITRSPDVDLVYGHHAHVSQPFDRVHGTWVAYGLGNLVAQQETSRPDTYRGTMAEFTFRRRPDGSWRVSRAGFVATQITQAGQYGPGMRVLDAAAALRDPATPDALLPVLRETVAQVREASFALGADRLGLRPVRPGSVPGTVGSRPRPR